MSYDICGGCKKPTFRCECKDVTTTLCATCRRPMAETDRSVCRKCFPGSDTEWRDIATAPLDGTRVLLAWEGQPGVVIGWYGPKLSTYGVNYGDAWGNGEMWRDEAKPQPTHWMPLPKAPGKKS